MNGIHERTPAACSLRDDPLTSGEERELGFTEPDREQAGRYLITDWTLTFTA